MSEFFRVPIEAERPGSATGGGERRLIVAPATPPGRGALAVVRWSGLGLDDHLRRLFPSLRSLPPFRRATLATMRDEAGPVDQGLLVRFESGRSFTGEASAEFSMHGSPPLVRRALSASLGGGAALASPGEFSRRAYLSGRLSVSQVEAVGELGEASTAEQAEGAVRRVCADPGRERLATWRSRLVAMLAATEEAIDVSGERRSAIGAGIRELAAALADELSAAARVAETRGAPRAVLVGRANAGKSTIFNRLVGVEAALVSAVPGTTRDAIRELLSIGDGELLLVDTAGDDGEGGELGAMAAARGRLEADGADLLLVVVGPEEGTSKERVRSGLGRLAGRAGLVLISKADAGCEGHGFPPGVLPISARTGFGWNEFKQCLDHLARAARTAAAFRSDFGAWGKSRLGRAAEALCSGDSGQSLEMSAEDLRTAIAELDSADGVALSEEVLDEMFARFCIGK